MKTTRCTISTLSPVHIGCGEDYYPTNYVIDGGFLHHFGEEALSASLNPTELNNLVKLANEADEDGIREIQGFIYTKKDQLKKYAINTVAVSKGLEDFYKSRIGKTSQHETGGKKVKHKLEIARHAYNPYSQLPFFAGSSIKGVIRTALLNSLNNWTDLTQVFRDLTINDDAGKLVFFDKNKDIPKEANGKLQNHLLNYQNIEDDPFRYLKISDANYQHLDNLHGLEIRFSVNCKKEKIRLPVIFEYLPANRSRSLTFDITFLKDCHWNIQKIVEVCNDFYLPQLEAELELLEKFNYANSAWLKSIKELLKQEINKETLNSRQAFLLRIGQHSGAESHTLENLRHIHIPQLKKYLEKPTSVWLSANNYDSKTDLLPFGWILVEIENTYLEQTADFLTKQCCLLYPSYQQQINAKKRAEQERLEKEEDELQGQELLNQLKDFSPLAQQYFKQSIQQDCDNNKEKFLQNGELENWLTQLENTPDENILADLVCLLNKHIAGLLDNPDKVKGRRNELCYKDRQRKIAQRIKALQG